MTTTATSELDRARGRIAALEALCADMYQIAGTVGVPEPVLDALWAASEGQPIPADLPVVLETDCTAVREREDLIVSMRELLSVSAAKEFARAGGASTSAAKQQAARANGLRGGRPRKDAVVNIPVGKTFAARLSRATTTTVTRKRSPIPSATTIGKSRHSAAKAAAKK